jgi:hypothetical protein
LHFGKCNHDFFLANTPNTSLSYASCCRPPPPTRGAGPGPVGALQSESDRARFNALQRRKLARFEDIVDDLEDLATDGGPSARELAERTKMLEEFRGEARRLSASFSGSSIPAAGADEDAAAAAGRAGVLGKLNHIAGMAKSTAGLAAGELGAKLGAVGVGVQDTFKKPEESSSTRSLSSQQLLDLQKKQMKSQDSTMDALDGLVGRLNATSRMIHDEVDLQARMVEDLDKDFSHTQDRMKKLRKQGFKLAGEKNEDEREKMDRAVGRCKLNVLYP